MSASWRFDKKASRVSVPSLCARRLRPYLNLAAIDESDRWIEDHLVPRFDTAVDLDPRALIALHFHLADLGLAIVDDRHLHSIAVENDRIGRHQKARRLARDLELDHAVGPGRQGAIRIRYVDFGQQRSRAGLQRIGDAGHRARKVAIRKFRHAHDSLNAWGDAEGRILGHVDPDADDVLLHNLEHEGAAGRIALHQTADIDIALGDNAVERRDDRGIVTV